MIPKTVKKIPPGGVLVTIRYHSVGKVSGQLGGNYPTSLLELPKSSRTQGKTQNRCFTTVHVIEQNKETIPD